ncbi:hypothetical protein DYB32_003008 [Aphanomyces invadans]|uniref:Uncharacterized protein n=1 Tax=Aphanomyces invadans TaxID=157072 RepID=A0A418B1X7_9STRA|nr:hypothetical protein DYB32_003008 [Aphanomyces invadans]
MKFLAGLIHVAVASQVAFDNLKLSDANGGLLVTQNDGVATRFRNVRIGADPEGLTVEHVIFTMDTSYAAPGTVLQVGICSSVNGAKLL